MYNNPKNTIIAVRCEKKLYPESVRDRDSEMIFAKKHNRNARIEAIDFKLFINPD